MTFWSNGKNHVLRAMRRRNIAIIAQKTSARGGYAVCRYGQA